MTETRTAVERRYVDLSHGRTRYLEAGAGPPVLLLHGAGFTTNADAWLTTLPALASQFRVLAPDFLNWGLGDPFDRELGFAYLADFVREFQDALGIERSHVVGHSMGGWVASLLAYESPQRIDKLVLVASGGMATRNLASMTEFTPPSEAEIRKLARERARAAGLDEDALADEYARQLTRPEVIAAYAKVMRHMTDPLHRPRYSMARRLPHVKLPTLIVWGARDQVNDLSMGEATQALIEGSRLVVLDCGHGVPAEQPAEFQRAVLEFLAGQPVASAARSA